MRAARAAFAAARAQPLAPPGSLVSPGPDERDGLTTFFSPRATVTAALRARYEATRAAAVELDADGAVLLPAPRGRAV